MVRLGLKRGSVELLSHQEEWDKNAENVILELKQLLGNAAVDIQHVGSTAIYFISINKPADEGLEKTA